MTRTRKPLILIELLLMTLFLAIAGAVIARTFAAAQTGSARALARTCALYCAEDIIERFRSGETDAESYLNDAGFTLADGNYVYKIAADSGAVELQAVLIADENAALTGFTLTGTDAQGAMFALPALRYQPKVNP